MVCLRNLTEPADTASDTNVECEKVAEAEGMKDDMISLATHIVRLA